MDQLNSEVEVPSALPLDQLCSGALNELLIRGYSRRTVNRYTLVWRHLAEFAREQDLGNRYSRSLAMRFEELYGLREGRRLEPAERWRRHLVFGLRILDDYARTGSSQPCMKTSARQSARCKPQAQRRRWRRLGSFPIGG